MGGEGGMAALWRSLHLVCFCPELGDKKKVGVGCDGGRDRKKRKGQRGQGEKGKRRRRGSTKQRSQESFLLNCDFMEVLLLL